MQKQRIINKETYNRMKHVFDPIYLFSKISHRIQKQNELIEDTQNLHSTLKYGCVWTDGKLRSTFKEQIKVKLNVSDMRIFKIGYNRHKSRYDKDI